MTHYTYVSYYISHIHHLRGPLSPLLTLHTHTYTHTHGTCVCVHVRVCESVRVYVYVCMCEVSLRIVPAIEEVKKKIVPGNAQPQSCPGCRPWEDRQGGIQYLIYIYVCVCVCVRICICVYMIMI